MQKLRCTPIEKKRIDVESRRVERDKSFPGVIEWDWRAVLGTRVSLVCVLVLWTITSFPPLLD